QDGIALVELSRSDGDYPVHHDGNTPIDPSDDRSVRRTNADFTQGTGMLHFRTPFAKGQLSAVAIGLNRLGGVAGPAAQPTELARRQRTQILTGLGYSRAWPGAGRMASPVQDDLRDHAVETSLNWSLERQRFT